MSRSIVRLFAAAVVAAAIPATAHAQESCAVVGAGSCFINVGAAVTIPAIKFLSSDVSDVAFSISDPGWEAFLSSLDADTTVVSGVALTARTNTAYTVTLTSPATFSGGSWERTDLRWDTQAGACGQGDATQALDASEALSFPGTATDGETLNLCLGLVFPNNLASPKLAVGGPHTIALTLTIAAP